jgi:hypothetical protein
VSVASDSSDSSNTNPIVITMKNNMITKEAENMVLLCICNQIIAVINKLGALEWSGYKTASLVK